MSSVSPVTGLSGLQVYPATGYTDTQIDSKLLQLQMRLDSANATVNTLQSSFTNYRPKDIEDLVNSLLKTTLEGEITPGRQQYQRPTSNPKGCYAGGPLHQG